MNELDTMLNGREETLKPATKVNYRNTYARLRLLTGSPLSNLTDDEIILAIDTADITPSAKITLLIIAINIFKSQLRNADILYAFRDELNAILRDHNAERAKTNALPTGAILLKYLDTLFATGKYREYIVNYLLINYGVRNQDLNLIVSRDDSVVNNQDNFIILKNKTANYMRYVYKTSDVYGARNTKITSKQFIMAITFLLGDKKQIYLLSLKNGNRIADTGLGMSVKRMTLDGLGQSAYFKIMLSHNGKEQFEKLTASRGTDAKTALEYYSLDYKNELGAEQKSASEMNVKSVNGAEIIKKKKKLRVIENQLFKK